MLSSVSSKFDSLELRPPTPPRDISKAVDDAISFLDDSNEVDKLVNDSRTGNRTIDSSSDLTPSSSQDTTGLSNPAKRVGFTHHPLYYKVPLLGESSSPSSQQYKRSPSTKNAKPLKSILKLSNAPPPTPEDLDTRLSCFSPDVPGSFFKMLQSVIQQLAGTSRSSRLDAYLHLNGVLKIHEDVPDPAAMVQKMDIIMQFLSRDIAWKNAGGALDIQMINQALKLIMAILSNPKLSDGLDDDFKTHIIDRSMTVLEQPDMPKPLIKMHMYLLSQQRFRSAIMTSGKADKIVSALQTIEDRCSGNSIIATRLVIYARLLEQAPAVMLNRIREWLEHVFHGMLSSIKEIRIRAIDSCTKAGLTFGQQLYASKALHEMFETEVEEGQTYSDYLSLRLLQMVSDNETGLYVPQIWSAVILFFRSQRKPLESWSKFKSWVPIIQRCFNSSDLTIRYQASLAWDKVVFAVMPDISMKQTTKNMLRMPICTTIEMRGTDKFTKQVRHFALDSCYNLLHYSLRPGLAHEGYDDAWDNYVDPMLKSIVSSRGKGRYLACQILHGLLSGNTGIWNVNAALEPTPIKPEELPRLDPKWVRSRLGRILKLLEPALTAGMWSSLDSSFALEATWKSLMRSIADAGGQEVKTTTDLKEAIALLVGLFRRIWSNCTLASGGTDRHSWIGRYVSRVDTMLVALGAAPFAEDILATTNVDSIEVAPTPSHRPSKHQSAPQSPLVILFGQFYQPPQGIVANEAYRESSAAILERFISCKSSPAARLELLSRSFRIWTNRSSDAQDTVRYLLWDAIAGIAIQNLKLEVDLSSKQESQSLGHALRSGLDVLIDGLGVDAESDSRTVSTQLYDTLFDAAKTGAGDGGVTLAVMEPFAKALEANSSLSLNTKLLLATHMLRKGTWPKTRQSFDQARKSLWGIGLVIQKPAVFDPYQHVYSLVVDLANLTYRGCDARQPGEIKIISGLLTAALGFLEASPLSLLVTALRKMQSGFTVWVEDIARKTSMSDSLSNLVRDAWSRLVQLLRSYPSKDSTLLKALEPILVAGFASPHRAVVNETILFWNETFGDQQSLEYPAKLETVLRARIADADITLPTFPDSNDDKVPASLPAFFDSQTQLQAESKGPKPPTATRRDMLNVHPTWLSMARTSPGVQQKVLSSPAQKSSRHSGSSTPKARLRHNDSQIDFAPIDSSPLPPAEESQLMTEHQKEIKAKQQQNAQLFPDFSSSPMAQSTALPRSFSKRLDFVSEANQDSENEPCGTPTGLPDANGLVSEDLPSSPTPSSTRDASQGAVHMDDDQDEDMDPRDPPSSPPRGADEVNRQMDESTVEEREVGPEDTTASVAGVADPDQPLAPKDNVEEEAGTYDDAEIEPEAKTSDMVSATDYPSDSQLPTAQLQLEAEAAQQSTIGAADLQYEHVDEAPQSQSNHPNDAEPVLRSTNQDVVNDAEQNEVTRVEDSFVEPDAFDAEVDAQSIGGSQQSPSASKKRKRRSYTKFTTRKRKQQSPFQRVWSKFVGGAQEDDDDMEEEIVVASSQTASSPVVDRADRAPPSPSLAVDHEREPTIECLDAVKDEQDAMQPPPKRGRGRPKKSETPTPSQPAEAASQNLKRRASVLSNASLTESQASTSFVKDTPAPAKARKHGKGQVARNNTASRTSQSTPRKERVVRREATAVVVGSPGSQATENQPDEQGTEEDENTQIATPEKQLAVEQAASVDDRPALTPRSSMLGRLKDTLSGIRGFILGPQEEREFDDVLFELRREVHEAGRRGREQVD